MSRSAAASHAKVVVPTGKDLLWLAYVRYVIVAVVLAAVVVDELWLHVHPAMPQFLASVGVLVVFGIVVQLRLRASWPVTHAEFVANLVVDIVLIGVIMHSSGGAANPLIALLLLPVIAAAMVLPQAQTWAIMALAVGCYGLLLATSPLLEDRHPDDLTEALSASDPHLASMWVTFSLTAALVALFLSRMAQSSRERDRALARLREEALRDERIVALGTLAAGAAHQLGTPLGNVLLIADELERRYADDAVARAEIADLRAEIRRCKGILGDVVAAAGGTRAEGGRLQPADAYLEALRDSWHLVRPAVRVSFAWMGARPAPPLVAEQTLAQALVNLLDNAADAAPGELVEVEGRCVDGGLQIDIRDRGPGITPELQAKAGDIFFTRERSPNNMGLGIGLFLANATIERAGGSVRLTNWEGGGALTRVTLPLTAAEGERR